MKKIILSFNPVSEYQSIKLVEQGTNNIIDSELFTLDNFSPECIYNFLNLHNIFNVTVIGPKVYSEKFIDEIKAFELTKYSTNKIRVEYCS